MNTHAARLMAPSSASRASISAALWSLSRLLLSVARTACAGICEVSKANVLWQQGSGTEYRRPMRRL